MLSWKKRIVFNALFQDRISTNKAKELLKMDMIKFRKEFKVFATNKERDTNV
jgi:hypothetical protein